ncbi:uncharacterized protein LOC144310663 [Canis aureus]
MVGARSLAPPPAPQHEPVRVRPPPPPPPPPQCGRRLPTVQRARGGRGGAGRAPPELASRICTKFCSKAPSRYRLESPAAQAGAKCRNSWATQLHEGETATEMKRETM